MIVTDPPHSLGTFRRLVATQLASLETIDMLTPARSPLLTALLLFALGCATASSPPATGQPGSDEVLASPQLLVERYEAARERRKPELAYTYLALIHTLHPESVEDRQVFTRAAKLFKENFHLHRGKDPGSVWVIAEPVFMIQWILAIVERSDDFPTEDFTYLFRAMPLDFYERFATYARARGVFRTWDIRVTHDNGRVESISATRVAASSTSEGDGAR